MNNDKIQKMRYKMYWCLIGSILLPIPIGLFFYFIVNNGLWGSLIDSFNPAYGFMIPLILGFFYCVLEFFSLRQQIPYEQSKTVYKSNGQPVTPPLLGIDSAFYTVFQECESCKSNDYCAEYEGKQICKKCFQKKSGVVENE